MMINHRQATALAKFVHEIRDDWGVDGIVTAIGQARDQAPIEELAGWAVRAALNPNNRTPAIIAMPGPHREVPRPSLASRQPYRRGETCSICSETEDRCRAIWADDHEFVSIPEAARRARAASHPEETHA